LASRKIASWHRVEKVSLKQKLPYPALEEEIAICQAAWGSWGEMTKGKLAGPKSSGKVRQLFFSIATSSFAAKRPKAS
jgi:hypothetical protein